MNRKNYYFVKLFLVTATSVLFSACATQQNYLFNLDDVKKAVINYEENGQYQKELREVVEKAKKEFSEITPGEKSAVIFDVDETTLSNYPFIKQMDFGYLPEQYDVWEKKGEAKAISDMLDLYKYLRGKGFRTVFITGRKLPSYESTKKNLIEEGFTGFDTLIVKNNAYFDKTALEYKSAKRTELTKNGYNIAGTVGDQWSDLEGPYHGIQVKIPNYLYKIK